MAIARKTISQTNQLFEQASGFASAGRFDLAEHFLRQILAVHPGHLPSLLILSPVLIQLGQRDEAVLQAREAVRRKPNLAGAHHILAVALEAVNQDEQAVMHASEAIRLRPDLGRYHRVLCGIHIKLDQYQQAIDAADCGLARAPQDASLLKHRAMGLAGLGHKTEATAIVLELLRQSPHNASTHSSAGHIFKMAGDLELAETRFRSALAIDAQLPSAHIGLGLVRYRQGRWEEAKPFLEEGIALSHGEEDTEVQNALAAALNQPARHPLAEYDLFAIESRKRFLLVNASRVDGSDHI